MKRLSILLLLALPLLADQQQGFDQTVVGLNIGYDGEHSQHVVPAFDIDRRVGVSMMGFQAYSWSAFEVLGVKSRPLALQVMAVTGAAFVKPLGEYVYIGPVVAGGVASDGANMGPAGKFGGILGYRLGKSQHWSIAAVASADKTLLTNFTPVVFASLRYGFGGRAAMAPGPIVQFRKRK